MILANCICLKRFPTVWPTTSCILGMPLCSLSMHSDSNNPIIWPRAFCDPDQGAAWVHKHASKARDPTRARKSSNSVTNQSLAIFQRGQSETLQTITSRNDLFAAEYFCMMSTHSFVFYSVCSVQKSYSWRLRRSKLWCWRCKTLRPEWNLRLRGLLSPPFHMP